MEHRHQEMLEHLHFSQADEDHRNNQLDSFSAWLSSLHVLIAGGHERSGYGRVGMMDEVVGTKAKEEAVAGIDAFTDSIQVLFSFSHFYQNIKDNVWFKCGGGTLILSFYFFLAIFIISF